jgi:hypothetical protein
MQREIKQINKFPHENTNIYKDVNMYIYKHKNTYVEIKKYM